VATKLAGHPPHLLRLADGRLLSAYGRRTGDLGEFACLSDDDGRTWDVPHEIRLASVPAVSCWDMGYPASAQLADGTVLTVYYQPEAPDGLPVLMGTWWRSLPASGTGNGLPATEQKRERYK